MNFLNLSFGFADFQALDGLIMAYRAFLLNLVLIWVVLRMFALLAAVRVALGGAWPGIISLRLEFVSEGYLFFELD